MFCSLRERDWPRHNVNLSWPDFAVHTFNNFKGLFFPTSRSVLLSLGHLYNHPATNTTNCTTSISSHKHPVRGKSTLRLIYNSDKIYRVRTALAAAAIIEIALEYTPLLNTLA